MSRKDVRVRFPRALPTRTAVVELVDTPGSGPGAGTQPGVEVRRLSAVPSPSMRCYRTARGFWGRDQPESGEMAYATPGGYAVVVLDERLWSHMLADETTTTWNMEQVMGFTDPPDGRCEPRRVFDGACPRCDLPLMGRDKEWAWLWCNRGCKRFWRLRIVAADA